MSGEALTPFAMVRALAYVYEGSEAAEYGVDIAELARRCSVAHGKNTASARIKAAAKIESAKVCSALAAVHRAGKWRVSPDRFYPDQHGLEAAVNEIARECHEAGKPN